jgi:hypothetical protein
MLCNVAPHRDFIKIGYTQAKTLRATDRFWDDSLIPGITDLIGIFHIAICDNSLTVYHKMYCEVKNKHERIFYSEYNNEIEKKQLFNDIQELINEKIKMD